MSEQQSWRERNKFKVQAVALLGITVGSFGLYAALNAGFDALATVAFSFVTLSMALTMWIS